jgi:hypothetical protein
MALIKRFTYGNNPAASDVDAVRFLVGDTNSDRPLLDDREVEWAITQYPDRNLAAASLAEHLFGVFASKGDFKVGPVNKSYSKVADLFKQKADQLRAEACKGAIPSFPATHFSTKRVLEQNADLTRPQILVGISDNPFALQLNEEFTYLGNYGRF